MDRETSYFEKVLTHRDDLGSCQCLDYIFSLELLPNASESNNNDNGGNSNCNFEDEEVNQLLSKYHDPHSDTVITVKRDVGNMEGHLFKTKKKHLEVLHKSARVVKHLISELNLETNSRIYTQLSDHYGVSCLLKCNNSSREHKCREHSILEVKEHLIDEEHLVSDKK